MGQHPVLLSRVLQNEGVGIAPPLRSVHHEREDRPLPLPVVGLGDLTVDSYLEIFTGWPREPSEDLSKDCGGYRRSHRGCPRAAFLVL